MRSRFSDWVTRQNPAKSRDDRCKFLATTTFPQPPRSTDSTAPSALWLCARRTARAARAAPAAPLPTAATAATPTRTGCGALARPTESDGFMRTRAPGRSASGWRPCATRRRARRRAGHRCWRACATRLGWPATTRTALSTAMPSCCTRLPVAPRRSTSGCGHGCGGAAAGNSRLATGRGR